MSVISGGVSLNLSELISKSAIDCVSVNISGFKIGYVIRHKKKYPLLLHRRPEGLALLISLRAPAKQSGTQDKSEIATFLSIARKTYL